MRVLCERHRSAHHPIEAPGVGEALELVFAGVLERQAHRLDGPTLSGNATAGFRSLPRALTNSARSLRRGRRRSQRAAPTPCTFGKSRARRAALRPLRGRELQRVCEPGLPTTSEPRSSASGTRLTWPSRFPRWDRRAARRGPLGTLRRRCPRASPRTHLGASRRAPTPRRAWDRSRTPAGGWPVAAHPSCLGRR